MKSLLYLFVCTIGLSSFAQDSTVQLNFNNVNATISNTGQYFHNNQNLSAGYEIPQGTGLNVMYNAQFWYAAETVGGDILMCLGGNGSASDVDRGPYSSNNSYADPSYDKAYMIKLCQDEIDHFKLWWECNNGLAGPECANLTQPAVATLNSIYGWPGNGNTALGQSAQLAHYFDRDGDGFYDPISSGDYPIIKGCCATYLIQNDAGSTHTASGTAPIGIESHYMFYQYGNNDLLYNTTFVDVMTINRGGTNYPKFCQSFYVDADLGNPLDDYFGSDSINNMMMFYNGDNLDENAGSTMGYQANPPAIGVVALENPLTAVVPYWFNGQNAGVYNQMNGSGYNGTPWIDPTGTGISPTHFAFSGNPNDPIQWSQASYSSGPTDTRGLMTSTYTQFNAGDTIKQSYAIIYSRIGNHLENAEHLSTLATEVQAFYNSGDTDCDAGGFTGIPESESAKIRIYPNPNNGVFVVESPEVQIKSIRVFNLTGAEMSYEREDQGLTFELSIDDYVSGVYLVYVETERGHQIERMIIE